MPQARQKVLRRSLLPTSQRNRRLLRPRSQIATRRKAHVSSGGGRRSATRPRQKPRRPVARRPPGASSRQRPPRAVHVTAATRTLCAWLTRRARAPSATRASQAARAATPRTASGRRARWRRRACLWRAWARTARAKRAWCALRRVCTASTCAIQSRAHGCAALTAEMLPRALSSLRMERTGGVAWWAGLLQVRPEGPLGGGVHSLAVPRRRRRPALVRHRHGAAGRGRAATAAHTAPGRRRRAALRGSVAARRRPVDVGSRAACARRRCAARAAARRLWPPGVQKLPAACGAGAATGAPSTPL